MVSIRRWVQDHVLIYGIISKTLKLIRSLEALTPQREHCTRYKFVICLQHKTFDIYSTLSPSAANNWTQQSILIIFIKLSVRKYFADALVVDLKCRRAWQARTLTWEKSNEVSSEPSASFSKHVWQFKLQRFMKPNNCTNVNGKR